MSSIRAISPSYDVARLSEALASLPPYVFAELDQARRRMLATAVAGYEQVLITAAVFDDVPETLTAHTVRIEAGAIVAS